MLPGGVLTAEWEVSREKRCEWVEMCREGFPSRGKNLQMRKWETLKKLQIVRCGASGRRRTDSER